MSREAARNEARRVAQAAAAESCAAVLGEVSALLRRFVVMSSAQARVVALWTIHTHLVGAADASPYLAVTSPEKRSGKTRLLEVLELLVARPWFTGRTTAAVLPRKIDADSPTLLLDESDAAFNGDKEYAEALRGVLNTGHRRGGRATVCVGRGANVGFKDFSTFCPKAIAGIGKLPDTVADRAIPIRLKRRASGERVDRFRRREVEPQAQQLRHRIKALAEVAEALLEDARPALPGRVERPRLGRRRAAARDRRPGRRRLAGLGPRRLRGTVRLRPAGGRIHWRATSLRYPRGVRRRRPAHDECAA
jgi:Protein of unknown function (DUF3631)